MGRWGPRHVNSEVMWIDVPPELRKPRFMMLTAI